MTVIDSQSIISGTASGAECNCHAAAHPAVVTSTRSVDIGLHYVTDANSANIWICQRFSGRVWYEACLLL
jgi:hypothetical protein